MPYTRLSEQRRMRPEIRRLLTPIYDKDGHGAIIDAEKVKNYPNVEGVIKNLLFFDHQNDESRSRDGMSKINDFEASMCARFASYLVKVGYDIKRM
jgi:hypothetical protein